MSFLGEFLVALLSGYLAVTSALADDVNALLGYEPLATQPIEKRANTATNTAPLSTLHPLPSQYETSDFLPRVLVENAAYQSAAVGASQTATGSLPADTPTDALVNIFCTYHTPEQQQFTTGTGFFISPDGVIMTNAHVAQFFLLASQSESSADGCTIRTGSPATPTYTATLLYLPPSWLVEHANLIAAAVPQGTGERDYALLLVTGSTEETEPLPGRFPHLAVRTSSLPRTVGGDTVRAAGYPAEKLQVDGAEAKLIPVLTETRISELFTFGGNRADVLSLTGSALGEHGASGGPVMHPDGAVIGLITTRGDDAADGAGSLRAISLAHINRTIEEETGTDLRSNLAGNLTLRAEIFRQTMQPFLERQLEKELAGE